MPFHHAPEPRPVPRAAPAPPTRKAQPAAPKEAPVNDLVVIGRAVPLFVLTNEQGQFYLIPGKEGRQVLFAHGTAAMARQLKERITSGNAALGKSLRLSVISLAQAMAIAIDPKQTISVALTSPAFDVAEGRKRVKPGGAQSPMAMPVFVIRNGQGGLLQMGEGAQRAVPAYLSFAEAMETLEQAKAAPGGAAAKLDIESAEMRDFLNALRAAQGGSMRFRLVPPRESIEAARGVGRVEAP
ncbi:MAG: hypothetical protein ACKO5K_16420 [Armatimonadota bacterium]